MIHHFVNGKMPVRNLTVFIHSFDVFKILILPLIREFRFWIFLEVQYFHNFSFVKETRKIYQRVFMSHWAVKRKQILIANQNWGKKIIYKTKTIDQKWSCQEHDNMSFCCTSVVDMLQCTILFICIFRANLSVLLFTWIVSCQVSGIYKWII